MSYKHLEQFEQSLAMRDLSANTIKAYIRDLRLFAKWFEGTNGDRFAPAVITPIDLREYKSYLLTVQELKPVTINRKLSSISAFCRWSVEQGLTEADPSQHISQVSEVTLAPKWLTKNEQYALIRSVQKENNARDLALIMVLLHTGLRVSEVSNLRLSDVKISERKGSLTVRRGKGSKYRLVPLNADVRMALSAYISRRPKVDHEYVFVGKRGERLKPWGIQYLINKYAYDARLENVTPHTLRHTCGKNLIDAGVPLDQVATLLGHKNLNTTRIYTTPSEQDLQKAVDRIALSE
jgi:site-specific recombinase XerD